MTTDNAIKLAIQKGAAMYRRLTPAHILLSVPDMGYNAVIIQTQDELGIDLSNCARMGLASAKKCIRALNCPHGFKQTYLDYLKKGGEA